GLATGAMGGGSLTWLSLSRMLWQPLSSVVSNRRETNRLVCGMAVTCQLAGLRSDGNNINGFIIHNHRVDDFLAGGIAHVDDIAFGAIAQGLADGADSHAGRQVLHLYHGILFN